MVLLTDQEYQALRDKLEIAEHPSTCLTEEEKKRMREYEETLWDQSSWRKENRILSPFKKKPRSTFDPRIPTGF